MARSAVARSAVDGVEAQPDAGDGRAEAREGEPEERTADVDVAPADDARADDAPSSVFAGPPRPLLDRLRYLVNTRELTGEAPLPQTVALTSSIRGEGVTTISQGFAVVLTEDHDARVCWVDLSWAGTDAADDQATGTVPAGIADVLAGEVELADALTVDADTGVSVLSAGSARHRATISYRSAQLDETVDMLRAEFDHIVFDMPPVLESSSALPLFRFAGAYLLVVRAGVTRRDQAARASRQLTEVPLLGTVLNRQSTKIPAFLRRLGSH
jgi:Mrp family chromosome partitioning ATPase